MQEVDRRILDFSRTTPFSYDGIRDAWIAWCSHYEKSGLTDAALWEEFTRAVIESGSAFGSLVLLYARIDIEGRFGWNAGSTRS